MASVPSALVGGMSLAFTTASEFFSISSFRRSRFVMNSWESIGAYRMSREDGQKERRVQSRVFHKVFHYRAGWHARSRPIEVKWSEKPTVHDARHLLTFLSEHPKQAKQGYSK